MLLNTKNAFFQGIKFLFLLLPAFSFGQKTGDDNRTGHHAPVDLRKAVVSFNCGKIESTDSSSIKRYLLTTIPNLKGGDFSVELLENNESKTAFHYLYRQNYKGKPVYRGTVKINVDKNGNISSLFDNTYKITEAPVGEFPTAVVSNNIIKRLYPEENNLAKVSVENLYFDIGLKLIPASRIEFWDKSGKFFEMIINSASTVVYERDMNSYFSRNNSNEIDTPAVARIFLPDPLTTAGVVYGTPYEDGSDADVSQLNMQRQQVTIDVNFENDTFKLESPYCLIMEHSIPTVNPVTSLTPDFQFTRSQDGFEDVNAFYHINTYHDYVQNLGFNNIVNYPIWVDTHGMGGSDNSNFSSAGSVPRLSFGEGGVDDAEDADVIIHEYGHAISYSAAPNTNNGLERPALDEGFGDYFAASYSKSINEYNWGNIFSWDGHNEFWNGRIVNSSKHYPEDLDGNIYKDAEIWSSTLMQISDNIGREAIDEVLIEALYNFSSNMTMSDAACLVIQADASLNQGEFAIPISWWMSQRGFTVCNVGMPEQNGDEFARLQNSYGFAARNENAVIQFFAPQSGSYEITDALGRIIYSGSFSGSFEIKISPEKLETGIYLTKVTTQNFSSCYKLMKW